MNKGKLIVFSAPSGSGKTTIVRHLLAQENLDLEFSISAATRSPRGEEQHGKDYYFMSTEEFKAHIKAGDFVEWEEVYRDNFYGTLKSEVERIWSHGKNVIFDIDVAGGLRIKKKNVYQSFEIKEPLKIDYENDSIADIVEQIEYAIEQHPSFLKVIPQEELLAQEELNKQREFLG